MIEEEAPQQKKKKPAIVYLDLWVYVAIENCTFDLVCRIFGWLEFGGNEKKEDHYWHIWILLLDFLFDKEGTQSVDKFFFSEMVCVYIFIYWISR